MYVGVYIAFTLTAFQEFFTFHLTFSPTINAYVCLFYVYMFLYTIGCICRRYLLAISYKFLICLERNLTLLQTMRIFNFLLDNIKVNIEWFYIAMLVCWCCIGGMCSLHVLAVNILYAYKHTCKSAAVEERN